MKRKMKKMGEREMVVFVSCVCTERPQGPIFCFKKMIILIIIIRGGVARCETVKGGLKLRSLDWEGVN